MGDLPNRPTEGPTEGPTEEPQDSDEQRRPTTGELAAIDQRLIELLNLRARVTDRLARQLAEQRQAEPADILQEPDSGVDIAGCNSGPLDAPCLRAVFRELRSGIRALWRSARAVYLGPEYSYSHLAAVERFGSSAELVPVSSIADVFEAVSRSQAQFGLVPMENSTDGRVADTLERFLQTPVSICGEVRLRIHHFLLGKCRLSEVREVYSKPQALSQCRHWLAKTLPGAEVREIASTAAAAQLAAEQSGTAAVASRQAGINYGLDVIAASIEDRPDNITRFAVIGDCPPLPPTGNDKTSLLFELPHRPGALADAMQVFKEQQLNLTWIESFPIATAASSAGGASREYAFFVELEGHAGQAEVERALGRLRPATARLVVLGCYPEAPPIG